MLAYEIILLLIPIFVLTDVKLVKPPGIPVNILVQSVR